jgi:hypothetical protein
MAIVALGALGVGLLVGFAVGACAAADAQRRKAVKAGVGRWVAGGKAGEAEFVYGKEP